MLAGEPTLRGVTVGLGWARDGVHGMRFALQCLDPAMAVFDFEIRGDFWLGSYKSDTWESSGNQD